MNRLISTAQVPQKFLAGVYLVGHIPQRSLAYDQRVSYALYVPPESYNRDPSKPGDNEGKRLPLLVFVHGTGRNSWQHRDLKSFADATPCAILAPLFPANLDGPNDLDSYTRMCSSSLRSDLAFLAILDEVVQSWPGINTDKVFLMGFSGGGQFTHRFLYLHPERLAAISVGAPGSATLLDDTKAWPKGTANVPELFGKAPEVSAIARVPIHAVIGSEDNVPHGSKELWMWIKEAKRQLGGAASDGKASDATEDNDVSKQGRMVIMEGLRDNWEKHGIESKFDIVEGLAHHGPGSWEHVLGFMGPLMKAKQARH